MLAQMKKFDYTKLPIQAQAVLLIGSISVIMAVMQTAKSNGKALKANAMVLIASAAAVAISTYNVRCLIRGNCTNWATVVAVAYVLTQGGALLAMQ